MNFSYNENQLEIKQLAEKIFSELANDERQKLVDASGSRFDPELWQQLAESGLLGIAIDDSYGGMGFNFESLCLLIEEAGRYVAPVPVIHTLVSAAMPIQRYASDVIKEQYLGSIANGKTIVTAALTNDNSLTATQSSDADWIIDGHVSCVPYAAYAQAVLLCATSEQGLVIFLVNPDAGTEKGTIKLSEQQSTACEPWSQLHLNQHHVVAEQIIASGDSAAECWAWMQQITIAAQCAMATGLSDKMLRMTAGYTSQREQFGRPVATFQAVGQRAADGFIDIECLRLCTQEAISLLSQTVDTSIKSVTNEAVTVANIWCGDICHRLSQSSQHLHGGIGVDRDYPLHRYCLWAKQLELSLGSSASSLEQLGDQIAGEFI